MIEVMKRKNAHSLLFDDLSQMIGKMNNKTVEKRSSEDGTVIVDVRTDNEYSKGHISNSKHIPVGIARKSLWEAYIYANRRSTFGKKIIDHPLLLRDSLCHWKIW